MLWWHSQPKTNCVPIVLSLAPGHPSALLWILEDAFKVGGNTAFVAQSTRNALPAFSAITGAWASLTVPVDTGDLFLVGSDA